MSAVAATVATVVADGAVDEPVGAVGPVVVVVVVVVTPALVAEAPVGTAATAPLSITPFTKRFSETASAPSGTVPLGAFGSVVTSWNS